MPLKPNPFDILPEDEAAAAAGTVPMPLDPMGPVPLSEGEALIEEFAPKPELVAPPPEMPPPDLGAEMVPPGGGVPPGPVPMPEAGAPDFPPPVVAPPVAAPPSAFGSMDGGGLGGPAVPLPPSGPGPGLGPTPSGSGVMDDETMARAILKGAGRGAGGY